MFDSLNVCCVTDKQADITPQNVLTEAEDDSTCRLIEEQETQTASIPSTEGGSLVYPSRRASTGISGYPILTDYGKARFADPINTDPAMPDIYRAPEIVLRLPWGYAVDMWSIGIMVSISVVGVAISR